MSLSASTLFRTLENEERVDCFPFQIMVVPGYTHLRRRGPVAFSPEVKQPGSLSSLLLFNAGHSVRESAAAVPHAQVCGRSCCSQPSAHKAVRPEDVAQQVQEAALAAAGTRLGLPGESWRNEPSRSDPWRTLLASNRSEDSASILGV